MKSAICAVRSTPKASATEILNHQTTARSRTEIDGKVGLYATATTVPAGYFEQVFAAILVGVGESGFDVAALDDDEQGFG